MKARLSDRGLSLGSLFILSLGEGVFGISRPVLGTSFMETMWGSGRSPRLSVKTVLGSNPGFLLISCVTLGRLDRLSEP